MRTTIGLDEAAESSGEPFRQETYPLGITIDVSNVAHALEVLEGPTPR